MKQFFLSIIFLVIVLGCNNSKNEQVTVITPEEMQSILDVQEVQLIDVRTPEEFNNGFIKDAQNINFYSDTFEEDILKLDKTKPVILYCKSGRRSAACSEKLIEAGFKKVYDLEGGITQWEHKGYGVKTLN